MNDKNKITVGLDVKLNHLSSLYHCIKGFINMRQVETGPNDTFKSCFNNIYEAMEIAGRGNILQNNITKNGDQA